MRFFNTVCITAGIALLPALTNAVEPVVKPGWEKLGEIVSEGIEGKVYPGAVLIVGHPDEVLFAQAFGKHTHDDNATSVTLNSMFDLASVSKVVGTTSAALILIQDGVISIDDPVSKYIEGFDAGGKESVTVRDLMTHTSGLKAYETYSKVEEVRERGETHADALIRRYAELETSYQPRTSYTYSCLNFQTTARLVENASGRTMESLLRERVYDPLGMDDTTYLMSGEQKQRALPTARNANGTIVKGEVHDPLAQYHGWEMHCPGNAGLFASAPDVARYCSMILNGGTLDGVTIFKPEVLEQATSSMTPDGVKEKRGLGWDIWESKPYVTDLNDSVETHVVGHTGYTGTMIWLDKKSDTYMVFFTNRSYPDDGMKSELTAIRKSLCDQILRTLPDYREYFANQEQATAEKHNTGG